MTGSPYILSENWNLYYVYLIHVGVDVQKIGRSKPRISWDNNVNQICRLFYPIDESLYNALIAHVHCTCSGIATPGPARAQALVNLSVPWQSFSTVGQRIWFGYYYSTKIAQNLWLYCHYYGVVYKCPGISTILDTPLCTWPAHREVGGCAPYTPTLDPPTFNNKINKRIWWEGMSLFHYSIIVWISNTIVHT